MLADEIYERLLRAGANGDMDQEIEQLKKEGATADELDCLLNPKRHPPVWKHSACTCHTPGKTPACMEACLFDAMQIDDRGNVSIDAARCVGCTACLEKCHEHRLTESKEALPVLRHLHKNKRPVFALVAPAFVGQFEATAGQLRTALKTMGFRGMVEVALFADILTLREALEFDRHIQQDGDYLLTSCCCPIWIAMIRKVYHELSNHLPGAVSPMIAAGRAVKQLWETDAITVFIGPCTAKKAEAREPDIADAVDYVLTFQELQAMFAFCDIVPADMPEENREHSSAGGRDYAHSGGVSEALKRTVARLNPNRTIPVKARSVDGVPDCRALLKQLVEGKVDANFIEGMACKGGCVGGPKRLTSPDQATEQVKAYADDAAYDTPAMNPYVLQLLHKMGFDRIEDLLANDTMFSRHLG